ncbi:MAG TPA: DUF4870 domain-containing protein [Gemmatimonadota bacterium]|nr:DUF4870 domain-containing protein [Gemmatimonadota bacterium]
MNDQNAPHVPPPPPGQRPPAASQSSTGLDPKLAGLLCYILGIITGLIFFLIEKSNDVVRFHAAQSIVFSGSVIVLWIVLMILGLILTSISWTLGNLYGLLTLLVWLGLFVVWVVLLIKGYSGTKWKLPVLGDLAERMASGQRTL